MNKHPIQTILEEIDESQVAPYTGRGMGGRECVSITGFDLGPLLGEIVRALEDHPDHISEVAEALELIKTDSLGHGTVIYFPNVSYIEIDERTVELEEDADEEVYPERDVPFG